MVISDIRQDGLDEARKEIESAGWECLSVLCDVASITGKNGDNSTVFVYGASKGALISLNRSVARQLGPFGVTCNAIAPHAVMTTMMSYRDEQKKRSINGGYCMD